MIVVDAVDVTGAVEGERNTIKALFACVALETQRMEGFSYSLQDLERNE